MSEAAGHEQPNTTHREQISVIDILNWFYLSIKSLVLGTKYVLKHQDLQRMHLKLNKYE